MRSRLAKIQTEDGGSVSYQLNVSPGRYAGAYFRFNPEDLSPDVTIENMGRNLGAFTGVAHDQLEELAPADELLISGDVNFSVVNSDGDGTVFATIFLHYE